MEILVLDGLKKELSQPRKIFITTHAKPDGDAIGSTMGLYHFLIQYGHQVRVVIPSAMPEFLEWIPGIPDAVTDFEKKEKEALLFLQEAELIFCLDFNRMSRVQGLSGPLQQAVQKKILIDHHLDPEQNSFQYLYSNPSKSSTCEMVYDFICMMDGKDKINQAIMQSLYTGLMTDTGSFRFPATTASVHLMIADFMNRGFNHTLVHEAIYDSWSEQRMRLLGYLLSEKMVIYQEQHYGYIYVTQDDLLKFNAANGDTEGVVNYILGIRDIQVAILITERYEGMKLSFRSKGDVNVNFFAHRFFEGGGHFNASGATTAMAWKDVEEILKTNIPLLIQNKLN